MVATCGLECWYCWLLGVSLPGVDLVGVNLLLKWLLVGSLLVKMLTHGTMWYVKLLLLGEGVVVLSSAPLASLSFQA